MPGFKCAFLSFLLLTTSCVKGDTTTVTLFQVGPTNTALVPSNQAVVINISAIGVGANGGTTYVGPEIDTISVEVVLPGTSPVTTHVTQVIPATATLVEAASWIYMSFADASNEFNGFEANCTLGNGTTSECIQIDRTVEDGTTTVTATKTLTGLVAPLYTVTVTGPIPTAKNAATILGSAMFSNRLSGVVLGIFFSLMDAILPGQYKDLPSPEPVPDCGQDKQNTETPPPTESPTPTPSQKIATLPSLTIPVKTPSTPIKFGGQHLHPDTFPPINTPISPSIYSPTSRPTSTNLSQLSVIQTSTSTSPD
ncbi:hypothetical protein BYT27DRAFT_7256775 [Phlegmacium glaucopus]|nr:hypothetical protein BYT27DRAFT_7256775 [Phlegmacium glaucopus]